MLDWNELMLDIDLTGSKDNIRNRTILSYISVGNICIPVSLFIRIGEINKSTMTAKKNNVSLKTAAWMRIQFPVSE